MTGSIVRVEIPDNRRPEVCAACPRVCCTKIPGIVWPMDLATDRTDLPQAIAERLRTGRYALDWWEGDILIGGPLDRTYYLRPAVKGYEGQIKDPSWGGHCAFLTPSGCAHEWKDRPTGCKAVTPNPDDPGDCDGTLIDRIEYADKKTGIRAWRKYQTEILAALEKL